MPIVHMTTDLSSVPADAVNLKPYKDGGPEGLHTYETHVGLCVAERERNTYDDSDFFMVVLNPETDAFEEVMFASTRGWTYPCMASHRDAGPELTARYHAEQEAKRQRIEEAAVARYKAERLRRAEASGLDAEQVSRVLALPNGEALILFLGRKVRSDFKKGLQEQVRHWARQERPAYPTPLSRRQLAYVG